MKRGNLNKYYLPTFATSLAQHFLIQNNLELLKYLVLPRDSHASHSASGRQPAPLRCGGGG